LLDQFELDRPVRLLGVRLELAAPPGGYWVRRGQYPRHMLATTRIRGYRPPREIVLPLRRLTVVTGANGTGKSSLYRAMRLLADCGRGEVIGSLAREGGLESVLWSGPEQLGGARR